MVAAAERHAECLAGQATLVLQQSACGVAAARAQRAPKWGCQKLGSANPIRPDALVGGVLLPAAAHEGLKDQGHMLRYQLLSVSAQLRQDVATHADDAHAPRQTSTSLSMPHDTCKAEQSTWGDRRVKAGPN